MTSREIAEYRALFLLEAREDETPTAPAPATTPEDDVQASLERLALENLDKVNAPRRR